MSFAFLVQQMTMTIRLLATACFVCAQVKVEHPVSQLSLQPVWNHYLCFLSSVFFLNNVYIHTFSYFPFNYSIVNVTKTVRNDLDIKLILRIAQNLGMNEKSQKIIGEHWIELALFLSEQIYTNLQILYKVTSNGKCMLCPWKVLILQDVYFEGLLFGFLCLYLICNIY